MTARLPLFPLATVLFPGLVMPLHVFEPRYRELVRHLEALPADQSREFGVVAIRRGWEVEATHAGGLTMSAGLTLYEVGCTAELRQITEHPDGRYDLVTVGKRRFRLNSVDSTSAPYLIGDVEWIPEPSDPPRAHELAGRVLALFQLYLSLVRTGTTGGEQLPDRPAVLSYLVAATTALPLDDRQQLLAAADTVSRLKVERALLNREVTLLRQLRALPVPLADLAVPTSAN